MPDNPHIHLEKSMKTERNVVQMNIPYYIYGSKTLNYAFANIQQLYSKFIGAPHFRYLVRVLGYSGIALLLEELLNSISNKIQSTIAPFVSSLKQALNSRETRFDFKTVCSSAQTFSALKSKLGKVLSNELRICQEFREIGNSLLFCLHIEQALSQEEVCDLLQSFPFQKVFPHLYTKDTEKHEAKMKRLENRYASLHVVSNIEKYGNKKVCFRIEKGFIFNPKIFIF